LTNKIIGVLPVFFRALFDLPFNILLLTSIFASHDVSRVDFF